MDCVTFYSYNMKTTTTLTLFLLTLLVSCGTRNENVKIQWVDDLQGDFSFTQKWSYDENIFLNQFGQLVCDGLCDEALDDMRDMNGRILDDSLNRYYQLVDTTHFYHSISSQAQCYEWVGTDFAIAYRVGDTVRCYTLCNVATHSSLQLSIVNNECIPLIELNSVSPRGLQYFSYKSGNISVDSEMWKKGILKAEFDFTFNDPDNAEEAIWWKGRIYTKVAESDQL